MPRIAAAPRMRLAGVSGLLTQPMMKKKAGGDGYSCA